MSFIFTQPRLSKSSPAYLSMRPKSVLMWVNMSTTKFLLYFTNCILDKNSIIIKTKTNFFCKPKIKMVHNFILVCDLISVYQLISVGLNRKVKIN